ncbi:MFS transporter [Citrobacter amalonaticus]|uniref:MFS transporter n=1 Tax=Citrobacter amalonaticus TaxID=35703 RepID=UPI00339BF35E
MYHADTRDAQPLIVSRICCFTEAAFLNFFPIFYTSLDLNGMDAADKAAMAAYVISSFAGLFTIGRIIGGFITLKLGERQTLIYFSILSLVFIIISRMLVTQYVYLFMVFGFTMSVLFPTAAAIATRLTNKSGSVMGLIYVASGIGGAMAGSVIGLFSENYGISVGFNLIIGFVVIFLILALFIREKA